MYELGISDGNVSQGCTQLKRWPNAIDKAIHYLGGPYIFVGDAHVPKTFIQSVIALKTQTQGEKILCDIEAASMEIGVLLEVCNTCCSVRFSQRVHLTAVGILPSESWITCCPPAAILHIRNM